MNLNTKELSFFLRYLYSSKESILTLVNQYLYQTIIVKNQRLLKTLNHLLEQEIIHLRILGHILDKLGEYPIFATLDCEKEIYFNTYAIYYDKDEKTIIEIDEELINKIINNLKLVIKTIKDKTINNYLISILKEEYKHLEELKNI